MGEDANQFDNYNQTNYYNQNTINPNINQQIQQKSNYGKWILIGLGIFFAVIIFLIIFNGSSEISEQDFLQGKNLDLKENNKVNFEIDTEEHTLTVESVEEDSINILIQSNPIRAKLKIGEEKKFDLDSDGDYDILVRLNSIIDGEPNVYIKKIREKMEEEIVVEEFEEEEISVEIENDTMETNASDTVANISEVEDKEEYILREVCGTSEDLSTLPKVTGESNMGTIKTNNCSSDETSVCMGRNLLECSEGKAIINSEGNFIELEIKEKIGGNCKVRVEYGEMEEVALSNKYIECLFPISDMPLALCMGKECSFANDSSCYVTLGVIGSLTLQLAFGGENCEIGYPEDKGPTIELASCEREVSEIVSLNTLVLCLEPFILKKGYTWDYSESTIDTSIFRYFYEGNLAGEIYSEKGSQEVLISEDSLGGDKALINQQLGYSEITPEIMLNSFQ
ncbi:MAG: hypothetical protein ABFQ65_03915 [Nanoarchaeota archaeon]